MHQHMREHKKDWQKKKKLWFRDQTQNTALWAVAYEGPTDFLLDSKTLEF